MELELELMELVSDSCAMPSGSSMRQCRENKGSRSCCVGVVWGSAVEMGAFMRESGGRERATKQKIKINK